MRPPNWHDVRAKCSAVHIRIWGGEAVSTVRRDMGTELRLFGSHSAVVTNYEMTIDLL